MRKIKNNKGFTLIEMLACIVTLILIGLICSAGMNLATMSLRESTFESDSQMLESTINMYVGDILRHVTEVETEDDGTVVSFTNDSYYIDEGNFIISKRGSEELKAGYLLCTSQLALEEVEGTMLVNEGAYVGNLYIKDFVLSYDKAKKVFSGSYIIVSSLTTRTKLCKFSYRTIAIE